VKIDHLDAISPWIAEVAAKSGDQFEVILFRELIAHLTELRLVADHDAKMPIALIVTHPFVLEHCQKLMLPEFEERVALTFIEFFQTKDVHVKGDCLVNIAHLDGDVIAAEDFNAHGAILSRLFMALVINYSKLSEALSASTLTVDSARSVSFSSVAFSSSRVRLRSVATSFMQIYRDLALLRMGRVAYCRREIVTRAAALYGELR
jgi:hypothetical protein